MNQEKYDVVFRLDIPATFKYLNVVSSSITAVLEQTSNLSERDTLIYNIILAVHEICTNIVEHAYEGKGGRINIEICLNEQPDHLSVNLYDTGNKFDFDSRDKPDMSEALVRGYGLFLVNELMDEVSYYPGPDQNHWYLRKEIV